MTKYYPVCLDLSGRRCLVAGGGAVALRKARDLLRAGAEVTAVAPKFVAGFNRLRRINLVRRRYGARDLRGCAVVIAASGDGAVNRRVCADARRGRVLVNVVDAPEMCDFIVPSTLRRGGMTISVSTGGASPALARKIRREMERLYPASYARYVRFLAEMRRLVRENVSAGRRRAVLRRIIEGRAWAVLTGRGAREARKFVLEMLSEEGRGEK